MQVIDMEPEPTIECDVKLPDKLSELIRVTVKDCRSLDPDIYFPDSDSWHEPNDDFYGEGPPLPVRVCLAGAVIAKSLGQSSTTMVTPDSFTSSELNYKLEALEEVRVGKLIQALDCMAAATGMPVIPPGSRLETKIYYLPDPPYPGFKGFFEMAGHLVHLERTADQLDDLGL